MVRKVRTEAGAKRYGVPIGSPIPAAKAKEAVEKTARKATPAKAASVRKLTTAEARRAEGAAAGFSGQRFASRGHAEAFTSLQSKRIHPDAVKEFSSIATALRAGHGHDRAEKIDAAMEPLDRDLVVTRHLPASAFGRRKPTDLVGKKIADKAYTPAALHEGEPAEGGYTLHISAPAGTKAMVAGDNEVWLDRDLPLAVQSVEPNDHGGYDVHVVALPQKATRVKAAAADKAPEAEQVGPAQTAAEPSPTVHVPQPVDRSERPPSTSEAGPAQTPQPAAADTTAEGSSGYTAGSDRTASIDYGQAMAGYNHAGYGGPAGDTALARILRDQGFDGKPAAVVSKADFDRAVANGEVAEMWRGIGGSSAKQYAEQYRTGDLYAGWGINGNGTYASSKRDVADYYGASYGTAGGGASLRIGLRKDAKTIDIEELDRMMDEWVGARPKARNRDLQEVQAEYAAELAKAKTARKVAEVRSKYRGTLAFLDKDPEGSAMRDPGRFAAARGYDAITIPQAYSPDKTPEVIILNRTATIAQEAE